MMKRTTILVLGALAGGAIFGGAAFAGDQCGGTACTMEHHAAATVARAKTVYTCPMHPEVQAEQPGRCPKCGMNLEQQQVQPVKAKAVKAKAAKTAAYTCPMDHEVTASKPGRCPKCGMNLERTTPAAKK
jgi:uncharacterized protein with PIN domain